MSGDKKTLGIIHAAVFTANTVEPLAKQYIPDVELIHCGIDSVQRDNLAAEIGTIPKHNYRKFVTMASWLQDDGCDLILLACSTFNRAVEYAEPLINTPLLQIDRPMMDRAVRQGGRIGLIGTLPSTMPSSERLLRKAAADVGRDIEVTSRLNREAFALLRGGDGEAHNRLVLQDIRELSQTVDAIVLAQVSMTGLNPYLAEFSIPVYTSGITCFEYLRDYFK